MKALWTIAAGGLAAGALMTAAPAAAQYYPGYGYGSGYPGFGYGGNVVGQVLGQVLGNGYGTYGNYGGGYGVNSQAAVSQCVNAVQARLNGGNGYGAYGYGGYSQYGNNGYAQGRVLGISHVDQRAGGGLTIRGVANSGMSAGYGYNSSAVDLTFRCRADYRGLITDVDINRAQGTYGSNYGYPYAPTDPYAAYGYRRY